MRMARFTQTWRQASPEQWTVVAERNEELMLAKHQAPFGEFVREYVEHLRIPWWRRLWWAKEWAAVEQTMRRLMNEHGTIVWIEKEGGSERSHD